MGAGQSRLRGETIGAGDLYSMCNNNPVYPVNPVKIKNGRSLRDRIGAGDFIFLKL